MIDPYTTTQKGNGMDSTTRQYLDSLLATALPNGKAFVRSEDIPLAKRLMDLGAALDRIEYADLSGNCWIQLKKSARFL